MPKPNFKIDEMMLVFIVAILAIIVSVYDHNQNPQGIEAEKITGLIFDNHDISFANNGVINAAKLNKVQGMNYKELKTYLNAKTDFCIYIRDGNGSVILAKGSSRLRIDGLSCNEH